MATMTLRGIDDRIAAVLKEKARKEGTSVNALMLRILKESLGIEKKKRGAVYDDLDHLAGTWSKKDAAEFDRAISVFEKVDEDMWKGGS
ncbi:MAG: antitoxin [Geobacter sp.]|nr:antitoxin [Geobacter sp.]